VSCQSLGHRSLISPHAATHSSERSPHPVFQRFAVRPTRSSSWPPSSCRTTRSGRTEHATKGRREGDWRRLPRMEDPPRASPASAHFSRCSPARLSYPSALGERQRRVKCCVHWHLVGAGQDQIRVSRTVRYDVFRCRSASHVVCLSARAKVNEKNSSSSLLSSPHKHSYPRYRNF
jgi:hypothetical protein